MTSLRAARRITAVAALGLLAAASPASAGRVVATGHDTDHHCGRSGTGYAHLQCNFFRVAVDYVRGGAPDPAKPVLVLDRGALDVVSSLDRAYGAGAVPRKVLDPRSAAFKETSITPERYSAVIIASSGGDPGDPSPQDLNEIGSTPDSDAINARASALRRFFDAGGGLFVNAGNVHGDQAGEPYYRFLPLSLENARPQPPYALTPFGQGLGLVDADVTCCPAHNTFLPPAATSPWQAIDTDTAGHIAALAADTPSFGSLRDRPVTAKLAKRIAAALPGGRRCVPGRLSLRLRRAGGLRFSRADVFVDGRRVRHLEGRRVTRPFKVRLRARAGTAVRVRIVIRTTGKRKVTIRRTYRRCA